MKPDDARKAQDVLFGNSAPEPPKPVPGAPPAAPAPAPAPSLEVIGSPFGGPSMDPGAGPAAGDFPGLPPDPGAADSLPSLEEELFHHGGSYLYAPEGNRYGWPAEGEESHHELLRLPEDYQAPEPFTLFADFLGADPIQIPHCLSWPGCGCRDGYVMEPRFVGYGRYDWFAATTRQNSQSRSLIGHNLIAELDLQLTGTERFHVQFRPLGQGNSGGSFYTLDNPRQYVNNATLEPTRYWFEGGIDSVLGAYIDPFAALDYNFVVGKFPFQLHNSLLIDDEIQGVVLAKNTIYLGDLSNLNLQAFYGFNDVDTAGGESELVGVHAQFEYRKLLFEMTYAFADHTVQASRDANYAGLSATWFRGPITLTGRGLFKWSDEGGTGPGELFVVELNRVKYLTHPILGVDHAVFFFNGFSASQGWNSIASANLNRLRTAFEVNPLIRVANSGPLQTNTVGAALGAQWFRHHEDESIVTEFAFEAPNGEPVYGAGLRYLRKTSDRSFLEVLLFGNASDDDQYDRAGVYGAHSILF